MESSQGKSIINANIDVRIFPLDKREEESREAIKKAASDWKGTLAEYFHEDDDPLEHAPSFYTHHAVIGAYRDLTSRDILPLNPRLSEIARRKKALMDINENVEDLGLVVYPQNIPDPAGSRNLVWRDLREQTRAYFPEVDIASTFVITGLLRIRKNKKFMYGLQPLVNDLTEAYNVPVLDKMALPNDHKWRFRNTDPGLLKTGFPNRLFKEGARAISTSLSYTGVHRLLRDKKHGLEILSQDHILVGHCYSRIHLVEGYSTLRHLGLD